MLQNQNYLDLNSLKCHILLGCWNNCHLFIYLFRPIYEFVYIFKQITLTCRYWRSIAPHPFVRVPPLCIRGERSHWRVDSRGKEPRARGLHWVKVRGAKANLPRVRAGGCCPWSIRVPVFPGRCISWIPCATGLVVVRVTVYSWYMVITGKIRILRRRRNKILVIQIQAWVSYSVRVHAGVLIQKIAHVHLCKGVLLRIMCVKRIPLSQAVPGFSLTKPLLSFLITYLFTLTSCLLDLLPV